MHCPAPAARFTRGVGQREDKIAYGEHLNLGYQPPSINKRAAAQVKTHVIRAYAKPHGISKRELDILLETLPDIVKSHQFLLDHQTGIATDDNYINELEIAKAVNAMLRQLGDMTNEAEREL